MKYLHFILQIIIISSFLGCSTTTNNKPKKWRLEKRVQIQIDLGMNYLKLNNLDVAREVLKKALLLDANNDRVQHAMGLYYVRVGQSDMALRSLGKAARLNSRNYLAVNDYGNYLCQNGKIQKGLQQLKNIELFIADNIRPMVFLSIGLCHYADQNKLAKQYLRGALKLSPNLFQALHAMADIYYHENNFLKARAFIERFFSTGSINAKALWIAARTEMHLGDKTKSYQYIAELRKRYPSSPLIIEARKLIKDS